MEAPSHALRNLGVNFVSAFASEKDKHAQKTIMANFPPLAEAAAPVAPPGAPVGCIRETIEDLCAMGPTAFFFFAATIGAGAAEHELACPRRASSNGTSQLRSDKAGRSREKRRRLP